MTEDDSLYFAFMLGWKIALATHNVERRDGDLTPEIHDCLHEIAEGTLTLVDSVAETARNYPDDPDVHDSLATTHGAHMRAERELALRLLAIIPAP